MNGWVISILFQKIWKYERVFWTVFSNFTPLFKFIKQTFDENFKKTGDYVFFYFYDCVIGYRCNYKNNMEIAPVEYFRAKTQT